MTYDPSMPADAASARRGWNLPAWKRPDAGTLAGASNLNQVPIARHIVCLFCYASDNLLDVRRQRACRHCGGHLFVMLRADGTLIPLRSSDPHHVPDAGPCLPQEPPLDRMRAPAPIALPLRREA